ncbi:MAG: hypothetical protein RhofKO_17510 [Rhodothermales bacterium]
MAMGTGMAMGTMTITVKRKTLNLKDMLMFSRCTARLLGFGLVFSLVTINSIHAQVGLDFERSRYGTAGVFDYTEDTDITLEASVTGSVRYPGAYTLKQGTTLRKLFAYSGGPTIGEKDDRVQRRIYVTLSRPLASGENQVVFEQVMDETIEPLNSDLLLANGDVLSVYIETRELFRWQNIFTVISTSASVITLIITAVRR